MKNSIKAMLLTAVFALTIAVSASVNGVAANPTTDSLSSVESTNRDVESSPPIAENPTISPSGTVSDEPVNSPQSSSELPEKSVPAVESEIPVDPEIETYSGPNAHVAAYCAWPGHWDDCRVAKQTAETALHAAQNEFKHSTHLGLGDAYRHCSWTAMMAHRMGNELAENFAHMHEQGIFNSQSHEEYEMDMRNNAIGIHHVSPRTKNDHEILVMCKHMALHRELWHVSHGKLIK